VTTRPIAAGDDTRLGEQIVLLRRQLEASRFTVVVTGAGISMGSGIKDMEHMNMAQAMQTSLEPLVRLHPERSYRLLRKSFLDLMFLTGPSLAHRRIAALEEQGLVHGVVTTNIDCLHTLAGSRNVAEIQGSYDINRCVACKQHQDDVRIWDQGKAPRCRVCGGVMVSFPVYTRVGVNDAAYRQAGKWVSQADLILAVGSKGMYGGYLTGINPAATIIQVNPKPTQFDQRAAVSIRSQADPVFERLWEDTSDGSAKERQR
jgi:NAD-dependent deacetylase